MEFEKERIPDFLKIFAASRDQIRSFSGCRFLQLLQDENDSCIFFTYSQWEKQEDLNAYRNSDLFQRVWANTRKLFRKTAEAWSLTDQTEIKSRIS